MDTRTSTVSEKQLLFLWDTWVIAMKVGNESIYQDIKQWFSTEHPNWVTPRLVGHGD